MRPTQNAGWHGIYPAIPTPLLPATYAPDLNALAAHARDVCSVDGIVGVMCNGHAGENTVLSRTAKRAVVGAVVEAIGARSIVVSGVNAEASAEAADHARDAAEAGADAIMVFAPNGFALGADAGMILRHHRAIAEATDLPLMLFQGSVSSRFAYPMPVLEELLRLPKVVAVKEGSWEVAAYERTLRLAERVAPQVAIMGSGDEHLMTSYVVGSAGSVVSLAAVLPAHIVALDRAVRRGDLAGARALHAVLQPLAGAIYGRPPGTMATARLKACLLHLRRFPSDAVMPPFAPIGPEERAELLALLDQALALAP